MVIMNNNYPLHYKFVRWLTSRFWRQELLAVESMTLLKQLHATPGGMEIHIQQHPECAQWVAKCFAEMVASSPNYTELKFDLHPKYADKWEWLTVLITKGNGKTPHQIRQELEFELSELKKRLGITVGS